MKPTNEPAIFRWTADHAIGVRHIDEERHGLFILAERTHQAMLEGKGKAALEDLLAQLAGYACQAFAHEEQLMEQVQYPGLQEHRREHEELRAAVGALQDRCAAGEATMTIEVALFLSRWLTRHTGASDRQIRDHMETAAGHLSMTPVSRQEHREVESGYSYSGLSDNLGSDIAA